MKKEISIRREVKDSRYVVVEGDLFLLLLNCSCQQTLPTPRSFITRFTNLFHASEEKIDIKEYTTDCL